MSDKKHPVQLGKYRITEVLGEGAMGVVYKGFDPDIQRTVALKTIRTQLDSDDDSPGAPASRFRNEAQAAGRLMHPGIVAVYDFGRDEQVAYIAMEYVEGRSLASYLGAKVRFTDTDIPGIMSQLLDALGHAHDKGVWHRDVKPANIILTTMGRPWSPAAARRTATPAPSSATPAAAAPWRAAARASRCAPRRSRRSPGPRRRRGPA